MVRKFHQFISDVNFEMNKVSWPNWDELRGSTYVVLVTTLIMIVFLFFVDFLLFRSIDKMDVEEEDDEFDDSLIDAQ